MSVKNMFADSSCAGVVSAGVACFFVGFTMLIWGIWDIVGYLDSDVVIQGVFRTIILSIIIWLLGWYFLHLAWRSQIIRRTAAFRAASLLILGGMVGSLFAIIKIFLA
jgi:hypothetical protein